MKNHSEGPEVDDPRGVEASNRYDSIVLFPIGEVEILMAAFGEEEVAYLAAVVYVVAVAAVLPAVVLVVVAAAAAAAAVAVVAIAALCL
jgi:hypothetical protein